jgi:hypothetical protein
MVESEEKVAPVLLTSFLPYKMLHRQKVGNKHKIYNKMANKSGKYRKEK